MEYILPLSMIFVLIAGIFSGYPVAFVLGGVGVLFTFIGDIPSTFLKIGVSRIYAGVIENWLLLAIPLFVFMGSMLEKSGLAQNLLYSLENLFKGKRGGLAVSVALLGIIMAASTGIIGASVVMLGLLALPIMLKQKYDPKLAIGTITSSATLGILIPPSIMLVLVGDILSLSVGDLFLAALFPGLLLGLLYILYIIFIAIVKPSAAPPALDSSAEHRSSLIKDLFAPLLLVLTVLGSIMTGKATPTEAAGLGAFCAFLMAFFRRKLTKDVLKSCIHDTGSTTSMIIAVLIGATIFSLVFKRLGGDDMIDSAVLYFELGPYGTLLLLMFVIFILGFFLEWVEISFIILPLFAPIISNLDFGLGLTEQETLLWFATLVAINLQTSFLTPPFGYALFYIKGICPENIPITTVYRSVIPFVFLQVVGLIITILWPDLILWLPRMLLGN